MTNFLNFEALQRDEQAFRSRTAGRRRIHKGAWIPSVDIYEDQKKLILEAELPGLNRDDFDLSVENNVLTLKGERRFEKKADGDNYHRVERSYGSFVRHSRYRRP